VGIRSHATGGNVSFEGVTMCGNTTQKKVSLQQRTTPKVFGLFHYRFWQLCLIFLWLRASVFTSFEPNCSENTIIFIGFWSISQYRGKKMETASDNGVDESSKLLTKGSYDWNQLFW
jgi:hypothetical protein